MSKHDKGLHWAEGLSHHRTEADNYKLKIVGFTGTRRGMTAEQKAAIRAILWKLDPDLVVHGDCVGADDDFDQICFELGIDRNSRPCTLTKFRAHTERRKPKPAFETADPAAPMVRNKAIVDDAWLMIACPCDGEPDAPGPALVAPEGPSSQRSGTWATVRMSRRAKKPIYIVFPSGLVRHERFKALDIDAAQTTIVEQHYKEIGK